MSACVAPPVSVTLTAAGVVVCSVELKRPFRVLLLVADFR